MVRTDGKVMALVEDSKSAGRRLYPVGAELHKLKIRDVQMKELRLVTADGREAVLALGVPQAFTEGRHAD
jgi:hypothetical protein